MNGCLLKGPVKTKRSQSPDQFPPRQAGRSLDINGFELRWRDGDAINHGDKMPQPQTEDDPVFQYALEFLATDFQRLTPGPYARAFGDETVEWLRIVDDLVAAHGAWRLECSPSTYP